MNIKWNIKSISMNKYLIVNLYLYPTHNNPKDGGSGTNSNPPRVVDEKEVLLSNVVESNLWELYVVQDITYTLYFQLVIDSIAGIIVLKVTSIKIIKLKIFFYVLNKCWVLNVCHRRYFFKFERVRRKKNGFYYKKFLLLFKQ